MTSEPEPTVATETDEAEPTPMQTFATYDEFCKLDIRLGTITAVAVVEDADKLLKLTVDLGEAVPRQIVSGIRPYFPDPDVLVGKQCPFVVNLEPRMIRGLESQGMIMAASNDAAFSLLVSEPLMPPGTTVN